MNSIPFKNGSMSYDQKVAQSFLCDDRNGEAILNDQTYKFVAGLTGGEVSIDSLKSSKIYVLGLSMLACYDGWTRFGYQRVDWVNREPFERTNYFYKATELPIELQKVPHWAGYHRGHVNTNIFCHNHYDSIASNSQLNIIPQNPWFNQGPMKTLEMRIMKQVSRRNVKIAHIISIPMCNPDETFPKKHFKVIYYELQSGNIEVECFGLFADARKINKIFKLSLRQVQRLTGLELLTLGISMTIKENSHEFEGLFDTYEM